MLSVMQAFVQRVLWSLSGQLGVHPTDLSVGSVQKRFLFSLDLSFLHSVRGETTRLELSNSAEVLSFLCCSIRKSSDPRARLYSCLVKSSFRLN